MPQLIAVHDKATIRAYAMHNPLLHVYEIGDLDDFFGHIPSGTAGTTLVRLPSWP